MAAKNKGAVKKDIDYKALHEGEEFIFENEMTPVKSTKSRNSDEQINGLLQV